MNLLLRHPIKGVKFMRDILVPAITFNYLSYEYRVTGNSALIPAIEHIGEDMTDIIYSHFSSTISPERVSEIVSNLESMIASMKEKP